MLKVERARERELPSEGSFFKYLQQWCRSHVGGRAHRPGPSPATCYGVDQQEAGTDSRARPRTQALLHLVTMDITLTTWKRWYDLFIYKIKAITINLRWKNRRKRINQAGTWRNVSMFKDTAFPQQHRVWHILAILCAGWRILLVGSPGILSGKPPEYYLFKLKKTSKNSLKKF